jgi:hypothetical protein
VEKSCFASLEPNPRVKGELVHFFCIFGFWGCGLLYETGLTGFGGTGLIGFRNQPDQFVPRFGTCSVGVCICARGALVCFGGLCYKL